MMERHLKRKWTWNNNTHEWNKHGHSQKEIQGDEVFSLLNGFEGEQN